jgi:hypothetical protein
MLEWMSGNVISEVDIVMYIIISKTEKKTCALWAISWYHRMIQHYRQGDIQTMVNTHS